MAADTPAGTLRVAPAAHVTFGASEIVLRSATGRLVLPAAAAPVVRAVLDAARTPTSGAAIPARVPEPYRAAATDLVDVLERYGVLAGDGGTAPSGPEEFFRLRGRDAPAARRRLADARVLVLGAGDDDTVGRALRATGVGAVGVADVPPGGETRAPDGGWDAVLADLTGAPEAAGAVHDLARGLGSPCLHVFRHGALGMVGPVVRDGSGPCWDCAAARLDVTGGPLVDGLVGLPPWQTLLRAAAAAALVDVLTGCPPVPDPHGQVVVYDLVTLESSRHPVVPLPGCVRCRGRAPVPRPGPSGPSDDAERLVGALGRWIDERTGVVLRTRVRQPRPGEPRTPVCAHAFPAGPSAGTYPGPRLEPAGGKGATAAEALRGAVCEAVERYCASVVPADRIVTARAGDLSGDRLTSAEIGLHHDERYAAPDFPFRKPDPDGEHTWVRGRWLPDGEPVWLPAAQVYYRTPPVVGRPYCQVTSSGLAAGRDRADAATRGALELVERHALLTSWPHGPAVRLDPRSLPDRELHDAAAELERCGVAVELYLLRDVGGISTVACLGLGDGVTWPSAHVGVAADPDPATAARRAVHELTYSGTHVARLMVDGECPPPPAADDIATFGDHALFYARPGNLRAFDALRAAPAGEPPAAPDETSVPVRLARAGIRLAAVDVTSPDLRDAPLRVVRVLSPDLVPLHAGPRFALHNDARAAAPAGAGWPHPLC